MREREGGEGVGERLLVFCVFSFYEWKRDKKKKEKQPYFVYFKDGALSLDKKVLYMYMYICTCIVHVYK